VGSRAYLATRISAGIGWARLATAVLYLNPVMLLLVHNLHTEAEHRTEHHVALTRRVHTDMPTPIRAVAGIKLVFLQNTHRDRHPLSVLPPLREPRPADELEAG
jgi:hypothetical protein